MASELHNKKLNFVKTNKHSWRTKKFVQWIKPPDITFNTNKQKLNRLVNNILLKKGRILDLGSGGRKLPLFTGGTGFVSLRKIEEERHPTLLPTWWKCSLHRRGDISSSYPLREFPRVCACVGDLHSRWRKDCDYRTARRSGPSIRADFYSTKGILKFAS